MFAVNGSGVVKFEKEISGDTYFQDHILRNKLNSKTFSDSEGKFRHFPSLVSFKVKKVIKKLTPTKPSFMH